MPQINLTMFHQLENVLCNNFLLLRLFGMESAKCCMPFWQNCGHGVIYPFTCRSFIYCTMYMYLNCIPFNYQVVNKCQEASEPVLCVTNHPGFHSVALSPWNLQAVYYGYRQQHGDLMQPTLHE